MNVELQNVELHIEELVLHGFEHSQRYHISQAIQTELRELLNEQGVPPGFSEGFAVDDVNAGNFEIGSVAQPAAIGRRVACAVYRACGADLPTGGKSSTESQIGGVHSNTSANFTQTMR